MNTVAFFVIRLYTICDHAVQCSMCNDAYSASHMCQAVSRYLK